MPYKEIAVEKLYWRVGALVKEIEELYRGKNFTVAASSIRYWMEYFEIEVHRTRKNERMFQEKDKALILRIAELRFTGLYTLYGILKILQEEGKIPLNVKREKPKGNSLE